MPAPSIFPSAQARSRFLRRLSAVTTIVNVQAVVAPLPSRSAAVTATVRVPGARRYMSRVDPLDTGTGPGAPMTPSSVAELDWTPTYWSVIEYETADTADVSNVCPN